MHLPGFVGGTDILTSTLAVCADTINWYTERTAPEFGKGERWLARRPGLDLYLTTGDDPVEALFYLDGRAFGVAGTEFIEVYDDGTYDVRGTVAFDGIDAPTICSNGAQGHQVFVTAGSNGYIFDLNSNAFGIIADVDFPNGTAVMGEFFLGYFIVLIRNSGEWRWSALFDGTDWDPLDVMIRSWSADFIAAIVRVGTHLVEVGTQTSDVVYATGGVEVFAPAQESLIEHGCVARNTVKRVETENGDTSLIWLDQSERGGGQVVVLKGLTPVVISTYAITQYEQIYGPGVMNAARAFAMELHGHVFYVLNNDAGSYDKTPVLDLTERTWVFWAHWDSVQCVWFPFRPECHMFAFERHFVGDRATGAIYNLGQNILGDELWDDELQDVA